MSTSEWVASARTRSAPSGVEWSIVIDLLFRLALR